MVQNGYPMVYRPADVQMLELRDMGAARVQRVMIRDGGGRLHFFWITRWVPSEEGLADQRRSNRAGGTGRRLTRIGVLLKRRYAVAMESAVRAGHPPKMSSAPLLLTTRPATKNQSGQSVQVFDRRFH